MEFDHIGVYVWVNAPTKQAFLCVWQVEERALKKVRRKIKNKVQLFFEKQSLVFNIHVVFVFCLGDWLHVNLAENSQLSLFLPVMQISAQESRRKKKEYMETLEKRWGIDSWQASHVFYNLCTAPCSFQHVTCPLFFIYFLTWSWNKLKWSQYFPYLYRVENCATENLELRKKVDTLETTNRWVVRERYFTLITAVAACPCDDVIASV